MSYVSQRYEAQKRSHEQLWPERLRRSRWNLNLPRRNRILHNIREVEGKIVQEVGEIHRD